MGQGCLASTESEGGRKEGIGLRNPADLRAGGRNWEGLPASRGVSGHGYVTDGVSAALQWVKIGAIEHARGVT